MSQIGDRFDEVSARGQHQAVARELKFLVTDINGWQTAYGYADGESRPVRRLGRDAAARPRHRGRQLTDPREHQLLRAAQREFDGFMALDAVA